MYIPDYSQSWAVVVGINKYKHGSKLAFACNDAEAVADLLKSRFNFPKENVTLLLDGEATLERIQSSIHNLAKTTAPDDRVVVFYAGHGTTRPAYGGEAGFLVPVDGNGDDTSTLLPWDSLLSTSRLIQAKHLLFLMDACYGGLIGMRTLAPGTSRYIRDMLCRYSRQFLTAGKADQVVADGGGPRKGHSLFTGHLLDVLEDDVPKDGIVSTNSVMANVYNRVRDDSRSHQWPHYGFLAGDGDLFFSFTAVKSTLEDKKDIDDTMVEVPADVEAPEEATVPMPLLEQVKEYLAESKHRIKLSDLITRELRAAQQRLSGSDFSLDTGGITGEVFAQRLLKYEAAMTDLLKVGVLMGRWSEAEHQPIFKQFVSMLAGQLKPKGGNTAWICLRYYPMLMLMYASGIAALDQENYHSLCTLFETRVPDRRTEKPVTVLQAVTDAMLDLARMDAFKRVPEYENKYTPQSELLFVRMQPIIEDVLFLGERYEDLFDRFEMFYALSYADVTNDDWGHPGRFGWKYRNRFHDGEDPFTALMKEAEKSGGTWRPVAAGMFQGSQPHFLEVAKRLQTGLLDRLPWH